MRGGGYMSCERRRIHVISEEEDTCRMRGGGYMSYERRRIHVM